MKNKIQSLLIVIIFVLLQLNFNAGRHVIKNGKKPVEKLSGFESMLVIYSFL